LKKQFLVVYLKLKGVQKPVRKEYLQILGLNEHASDEQIKKAWKKKVLQFHPDKNPNDNAQMEFIKVCDAYQKLSDETFEKIEESIQPEANKFYKKYNQNLTTEEVEKRRQKAREHSKYKEMYEEYILSISYKGLRKSSLYKFSNIVAVCSLIIGSILFLDYSVLEPKVETAVILNQYYNIDNVVYNVYDLNSQIPTEKREYEVSTAFSSYNFKGLKYNSFIKIYKSRILNQNISFSHADDTYQTSMHNRFSIYIAFWVFIVLFSLPILNFAIRGPNTLYLVVVHVNAYLPIFVFISLLVALL
jgi:curved DNA-binding protein CbpA